MAATKPKSYVVTGFGALVNRKDGTSVLVQRGGGLPDDVEPDHLKHLIDAGLVEEGEPQGMVPLAGDGTPLGGDDAVKADDESGVPAKSASKADWEAYARSVSASDPEQLDAIDSMTKEELIAEYGEA
jgi:hypothetical protein